MKITITSTTKVVDVRTEGGRSVPARIWEGTTASGVPVHVFITRLAPTIPFDDPRQVEFQRELQECAPPSVEMDVYPTRLLL